MQCSFEQYFGSRKTDGVGMVIEKKPSNGHSLVTLYDHFTRLLDEGNRLSSEKDKRNDERFEAIKELMDAKEKRDVERHNSQKEMTALALTSAKEATVKAEVSITERLEAHNNIRVTMEAREKKFAEKELVESKMESVIRRVENLEKTEDRKVATGQGKAHLWGYIVGVIGVLAMLWGMFNK